MRHRPKVILTHLKALSRNADGVTQDGFHSCSSSPQRSVLKEPSGVFVFVIVWPEARDDSFGLHFPGTQLECLSVYWLSTKDLPCWWPYGSELVFNTKDFASKENTNDTSGIRILWMKTVAWRRYRLSLVARRLI